MSYLVIGANGLIGREVTKQLDAVRAAWQGTCHSRPAAGLIPLDITDAAQLRAIVSAARPHCVIHCANTAGGVDFCEAQPERGRAFHNTATRALGELCGETGARLAFFSSECVFRDQAQPFRETDAPAPSNVYGRLKLEAERWIAAHVPRHLILRTTNVYGWDPHTVTPNYLMNLWRTLKAGKRFAAPAYSWATPTCAADLAAALIALDMADTNGLFHAVGPDFLSRHDWALRAAAAFSLDASLIDTVAAPPANMVPRPLKLRLDTHKLRAACAVPLRSLDEGLAWMRQEMA